MSCSRFMNLICILAYHLGYNSLNFVLTWCFSFCCLIFLFQTPIHVSQFPQPYSDPLLFSYSWVWHLKAIWKLCLWGQVWVTSRGMVWSCFFCCGNSQLFSQQNQMSICFSFVLVREKSSQLWQGNSQYSGLDQGKGLKDLPFFFPDFLYKSQF